jgi:hypothetical protein
VRFVDEYRDPALAKRLAAEIAELAEPGRTYKLMEVCGGHTHAIYKHGVEDLLPDNVELVHGSGCPDSANAALAALRSHPLGRAAAIIADVTPDPPGLVVLETAFGGSRVVDMLAGDPLPRIC